MLNQQFQMQNFSSILLKHNYKKSTIKKYIKHLKALQVDLSDIDVVKKLLEDNINKNKDKNGCEYRSLLLYYKYLSKEEIPGGRNNTSKEFSLETECLKHKSRIIIMRMLWLFFHKHMAVSTSSYYAKIFDNCDDPHRNSKRSKAALEDFPKEICAKSLDAVFSYIYSNDKVKKHYESLI